MTAKTYHSSFNESCLVPEDNGSICGTRSHPLWLGAMYWQGYMAIERYKKQVGDQSKPFYDTGKFPLLFVIFHTDEKL